MYQNMIKPLISVIMPAYNSAAFITEAIESVLSQEYENLELLVVNDGSVDHTEAVIKSFADNRIRYFYKENGGVSSARNKGLLEMKGEYFCFLDADDVFTNVSISSRLKVFEQNPDIDFVDGAIEYVDINLRSLERKSVPQFHGAPFPELLRLNEKCFIGNTWMIKKVANATYAFLEDLTHGEELFFYMTISQNGFYSFTKETILLYRQSGVSAMKNLSGLQGGYEKLLEKVRVGFPNVPTNYLRMRMIRIMFLSWLFDGKDPIKAILSIFKFLK